MYVGHGTEKNENIKNNTKNGYIKLNIENENIPKSG